MNTQILQQIGTSPKLTEFKNQQYKQYIPAVRKQSDQIYASVTSPSFVPQLVKKGSSSQRDVINPKEETNYSKNKFVLNSQINQNASHSHSNSKEDKQIQSEPQSLNYEILSSQFRKNQVRQFTLGNEFEQTANFIQISNRQSINNTTGSQEQYLGSTVNINNTSLSQNNSQIPRGSLQSIANGNVEGEQMKQIIINLQQRITKLEARVESNEEKIDLNERLFRLKDQQTESQQLSIISSNIKNDVENYVQSVILQQQQECDRTVEQMKKIELLEKKLKSSDENLLKFTNDIEQQLKESIQPFNTQIERAMKLINANASQIEKNFQKYDDFNSKITDLNDKIKLLQQNITLNKDEVFDSLNQYEKSLQQITKVQNNITEDLKQNIQPAIKGLEDDFLRILQNYKEMSDFVTKTKFLDEEMILLKHKVKIIAQKVNVNENWQVNTQSLLSLNNFKNK
ncbi:hypothetical protein TTHERM_00863790 (macronuclear) [Tetrahymena thermophila SB210]|uniref:Uncharacterized protein n=1 Tax=Tetrahymena thermophila (strain SB210) TaxID=312017 RepID=Q24FI4_TETTS|nr:hypothetical protein TTHERM_00863790 [Tetrahymena thermophila SB210]EAS06474.2 hypothetical protein TTHERM_00863790 [Tetrahymena thermophila SB210]|eukprot:XP_001026719.2 hypothetical protein TTHERM_00863790 [Tetrahymena thermophila SB210]